MLIDHNISYKVFHLCNDEFASYKDHQNANITTNPKIRNNLFQNNHMPDVGSYLTDTSVAVASKEISKHYPCFPAGCSLQPVQGVVGSHPLKLFTLLFFQNSFCYFLESKKKEGDNLHEVTNLMLFYSFVFKVSE